MKSVTSIRYKPQIDEVDGETNNAPTTSNTANENVTTTTQANAATNEQKTNSIPNTAIVTTPSNLNNLPSYSYHMSAGSNGPGIFFITNDGVITEPPPPYSSIADLPPLPVEPPPRRREKFDIIQCVLCTLLIGLFIAALALSSLDRNNPFNNFNFHLFTNAPRTKGTTPIYNGTLPKQAECGISAVSPNQPDLDVILNKNAKRRFSRIINGRTAQPHSWPWMVSIRNRRFGSHFCDGFLIYEQFVVTAAHCLEDKTANSISVVVGAHELESFFGDDEYYAESIAVHEMFDTVNIRYDIGIIKLTEPVTLSDNVRLICLPESPADADKIYGKRVVIAGWGRVDKDTSNILANELQETILEIRNGEWPCSQRDYDPNIIYCAIDPVAGENSNACNGDSGSPLFVKVNNKWYAYGITSYITGVDGANNQVICVASDPSYYTKLPLFLNWIAWKVNTM